MQVGRQTHVPKGALAASGRVIVFREARGEHVPEQHATLIDSIVHHIFFP